jgi:sirohydrochlorin cobaltochelatase
LRVFPDKFSDAVLVLVGHGSTKNSESAAPVYQHAAELRRRKLFADVRESFWKQEPKVAEVGETLSARRVFVVPMFISEGYFSEQVIPNALGFTLTPDPRSRVKVAGPKAGESSNSESRSIFYCRPIGTHDSMTSVLLARARDVVAQFPFPRAPKPRDTTLFVAGHGTGRSEDSRKSIDRQVKLIRAIGEYADVHAIFLEEEPRIGDCYAMAKARNIVVVPFFISDGMHTQEDIPVLLGEPGHIVRERLAAGQPTWRNPTGRNHKLVWYAPAVGTEPGISDVILERVREFANY